MVMELRWGKRRLDGGSHGRKRWPEVVDGHGWPPIAGKMSEKLPHPTVVQNKVGCFGLLQGFLQWLWWLPMVMEVLGGIGGSRLWQWVVGKWLENRWRI